MFIFLGIVSVLVALTLILAIVVQNSKGGGLSPTLGGSATQMLGARRSNEMIEKITWYLAAGLAIVAFAANIHLGTPKPSGDMLLMESEINANPTSLTSPDALIPPAPGEGTAAPASEPAAEAPAAE
ncbi:MAG: preprotein translocase subunit SecG [Bacteroidota bacterium]